MFTYTTGLLRMALSAINENDEEASLRSAESRMGEDGFWGSDDRISVIRSAERSRDRISLFRAGESLSFMEEALRDDTLREEALSWFSWISSEAERVLLPNERAGAPAIVTITAGAGGEDARDFALITMCEIARYAQSRGLAVETIDENPDPSGLRDATMRVSGPSAFLIMRGEAGKRRLVRKSPFGSGGRQTSFCSVICIPELAQDSPIIPDKDLRYETYRDTGPGGQHRNTTDSAVRVTHLPTGISAKSASRSQHDNRRAALATLLARVGEHLRTERDEAASSLRVGGGEAGFGGHSRTIVLDPYRLVRNEVSGVSTTDVEAYLSGGEADVRAQFRTCSPPRPEDAVTHK